jgi:hypothetical protein
MFTGVVGLSAMVVRFMVVISISRSAAASIGLVGSQMKTVVRNGVEYEERPVKVMSNGSLIVKLIPIPPAKKTLVEMYEEPNSFSLVNILDAIEQRLQALEAKLEGES